MKYLLLTLARLSISTFAQTVPTQSSSALLLEDGTPVRLRLGRTLSSEDSMWTTELISRFLKKSE